MKRTSFTLALLALGMMPCLFLASCDDDDEGCYPPTWKGFTYSPSPVHPGDSITITAVQASKGHYLNACDYSFSMKVYVADSNGMTQDSTLTYSYHTNYDGTDNGDPSWGVRLPETTVSGSYTCSFSANWSNSSDGQGGTYAYNGDRGSCTGSITSYSYTLYSNASGSFTLPVSL